MKNKEVVVSDLGLVNFNECWEFQQSVFQKTIDIKLSNRTLEENSQSPTPNHLFFVEHPHVYTIGKTGKMEHLLLNEGHLENIGASVHRINRGGDITYHGPGQIVGYPILDLDNFFTDMHKYLRFLEEAVIRTLADFGITGERYPGYTGVWLDASSPKDARKICAMGIRCSRWVTMHGFALNVDPDLMYFNHIVPCGISNHQVTSMKNELSVDVDHIKVKDSLIKHLSDIFGMDITNKTELTHQVK